MTRFNTWLIGVAAALGLISCGGCGSDEPAALPVCASLAAVQNTVDHIWNTSVSENGLGQMRTYLSQLRTEVRQLATDASAQFGPEAEQLRAATDDLSADIATARAEPNARNLAAVRVAANAVRVDVEQLRNALARTC